MIRFYFLCLLASLTFVSLQGSVTITGRVYDELSNAPIAFATVLIFDREVGVITNEDGQFSFTDLAPGEYRLQVSYVGYKTQVSEFVYVHFGTQTVNIPLQKNSTELEELTIAANPFLGKVESPLSYRRISSAEIELNPGANRDISKVVQSFPGVASSVAFRNDLIVRGGGPSENVYYLEGIEIPNLNHFATQGASGGPVGIINADLIREVDFLSGAFPANRGDAMSSVLDFKMIDGSEQTQAKFTLGASEVSAGLEGMIGDNTDYVVSLRRSYLQLLFQVLELPFLPTFTDATVKVKTKVNANNEITFLGIGAYDENVLNLDTEESVETDYILSTVPYQTQWSYTTGVSLKHFFDDSYMVVTLSNNHLYNRLYKYLDNENDNPEAQILDYKSNENELKLRGEHVVRRGQFKFLSGIGFQHVNYDNATFQKNFVDGMPIVYNYDSDLSFERYSLFEQVTFFSKNDLFSSSLGLRLDGNNYSDKMNLWRQVSPRLSASYSILPKVKLNASTGIYYQLPAYTTLGYQENDVFVNRENAIKPISSYHSGFGVEWLPINHALFSVEGFLKLYDSYPMSLTDSVSLASKGGGYELYGDEAVISNAKGRAYGVELMGRWNGHHGLNFVFAYTWVRSEFTDLRTGAYLPSAWDNKHLFSLTGTKDLTKGWHVGFKFRAQGGTPYTPYDIEKSSLVQAWDASGVGYLDYSKFNSERLGTFSQLDLRVDKDFYFEKWMLGVYFDVQNVLNTQLDSAPVLALDTDDSGEAVIVNPTDPIELQRYAVKPVFLSSGTVLPTLGIMLEF